VTDAGSVYSNINGALGVGAFNALALVGNRFIVSNGASAFIGNGVLVGGGGNPYNNTKSNSVVVTGAGSRLTDVGSFSLGNAGVTNFATISAGGQMLVSSLFIGNLSSFGGSHGNIFTVTDPGSSLQATSAVAVTIAATTVSAPISGCQLIIS